MLEASASSNTFSAMGKVTDRHGNPVEGATVTLIDGNWKELDTATTDANGNFDFQNEVTNSDTCRVTVRFVDENNIEYTAKSSWVEATSIQTFSEKELRLVDYPPPEYGYIWGYIQTSKDGGEKLSGVVYAVSVSGDQKYYTFADLASGTGQYMFYIRKGSYYVYAQHQADDGSIYESRRIQVDVAGSTTPNGVDPTLIVLPLTSPSINPDPSTLPTQHYNTIKGYVRTKDGKPYPGASVSLWQQTDDGLTFKKLTDPRFSKTTDANGYYQFDYVDVTTDDGQPVYWKKDFKIVVDYTDNNNVPINKSEIRPLFNPNMIQPFNMDNRNLTVNISLSFANTGWFNVKSDPPGARLFIDGKEWYGEDGKQLVTPCTAYNVEAGKHQVKLSLDGYSDKVWTINIEGNKQADDVFMVMEKSIVPSWMPVVVAIIILIIAAAIIIWLLASKKDTLLGPLGGFTASIQQKWSDHKAAREVAKAHRAEIAEQRRVEAQQRAEQKREAHARGYSSTGKIIDKNILHNVNVFGKAHKAGNERPEDYAEAEEEEPSMVLARDIYKSPGSYSEIERLPSRVPAHYPRDNYTRDNYYEAKSEVSEFNNNRIRIPRTSPPGREGVGTVKDKERVLRYIKEHPDGVSFIQMSNDLDIIPNNLTLITKELVINDDIEKVKGLYYYKSHEAPPEESSSSVVVWRLDGDK